MVFGALLGLTALAACLFTPLLCAALYLGAQLASSRLPPPKAAPAQDIDFPRAVVSLLLWYAIACVAASVHAELGFIAACFAVAACVSLPFVDGGHGGNGGGNGGGSSLMLFSLDVLDEPLSVAFLYAMLPLVCTLPLILAGPGAFVHAYLWGHLWWAAARYGSLPNALAASIGIALIVNSFDGFSLLECAPLAGTLAALPAGARFLMAHSAGFEAAGACTRTPSVRSHRATEAEVIRVWVASLTTLAPAGPPSPHIRRQGALPALPAEQDGLLRGRRPLLPCLELSQSGAGHSGYDITHASRDSCGVHRHGLAAVRPARRARRDGWGGSRCDLRWRCGGHRWRPRSGQRGCQRSQRSCEGSRADLFGRRRECRDDTLRVQPPYPCLPAVTRTFSGVQRNCQRASPCASFLLSR